MKILVEAHTYDAGLVRDICGDFETETDNHIKVSHVGYWFSPAVADCVLSLPKVVQDAVGGTVFGGLSPEQLLDAFSPESGLSDRQSAFVRDFSLWTYRAISAYARLNPQSGIVRSSASADISLNEEAPNGTLLDVVLALIRFYNENRDYFMYVIRNLHSGYERINWRKTVNTQTPVLQDGKPYYINVINRRKQIDFDEELMVIFHSVLHYISSELGMMVRTECNYDLISGAQFEAYLDGLGLVSLNAIKYKYFSDKDIRLWNLCRAFFEKTSGIRERNAGKDYLLVGNFEKVFEAMMDALISDRNLPNFLKNQTDGKIVDHIFRYRSPIDGKEVYYIGDSKYYSVGAALGDNSIYKQFTYAKNIIQYHFIKSKAGKLEGSGYRDEFTEGYNFTPNFFISALMPDTLSYSDMGLKKRDFKDEADEERHRLSHFDNRLFDRDTLWLAHFDVNLLYIIALYASEDAAEQTAFKGKFSRMAFSALQDLLALRYDFYTVFPIGMDNKDFVSSNFYRLHGKLYSIDRQMFSEQADEKQSPTLLILALERKFADENDSLLNDLKKCATVREFRLDELHLKWRQDNKR